MAHRGRTSENDMLIELSRIRRELGDVRGRMRQERRFRSGSFDAPPVTVDGLRRRATALILTVLAAVFASACWLVYSVLHGIMGGVFDAIVPEPAKLTVNSVVDLLSALLS